ncbi:MAG TPA: 7-cyano-7-deazaguanine synthase QueC [Pirellulaceae bacterium]|nr:7-cyano-7-deazaguanine synthase QueC [Pirellulaceae bacterium]
MSEAKPKAVVLLSGGLDSATVLAIARAQGFEPCAITFRYGQRHAIEIEAAHRIAASQGVERTITVDIDLRPFGGSALTSSLAVPKKNSAEEVAAETGIPVTYVPARNTIFLAYALGWAEALGSSDLFVGVNALDYSGYPDCRPEYVACFERLANLATKAGVEGAGFRVHAPLIDLTKGQIIRRGLELGVDYSLTRSCYDPTPEGVACGHCDSCLLRAKGFAENGLPDPAPTLTV